MVGSEEGNKLDGIKVGPKEEHEGEILGEKLGKEEGENEGKKFGNQVGDSDDKEGMTVEKSVGPPVGDLLLYLVGDAVGSFARSIHSPFISWYPSQYISRMMLS